MDDVRGRFLGLPHGTTPAAVTTNKNIKMSSFKSSKMFPFFKMRTESISARLAKEKHFIRCFKPKLNVL